MLLDPNSEYKFYATISNGEAKIENVLCLLKLPETNDGEIKLTFYPEERFPHLFRVSLYGEKIGFDGNIEMSFQANKVYCPGSSTSYISKDIPETVVNAEPTDLAITSYLSSTEEKDEISSIVYKLTPCRLINIPHSIERSYTGDVKVEKLEQPKFKLANGCNIVLDYYFQHIKQDNDRTVTFSELVAESSNCSSLSENNPFSDIDDFLMLTSFAARQRCICVGYELHKSNKIISYFRRDITIPKHDYDTSLMEHIIKIADYQSFIEVAYDTFTKFDDKKLLRTAIFRATTNEHEFDEKDLLRLYSAIETLVLIHRNNSNLNFHTRR